MNDISALPIFKDDMRYFSEVSSENIEKALDLSLTASMVQPWSSLYPKSLRHGEPFKQDVIQTLEEACNVFLDVKDPTSNLDSEYKVEFIQLESVASVLDELEPAFYSKWNVVIHRENKAFGFSFQVIFLHLINDKDIRTYFCAHHNHSVLFEDAVENMKDLSINYTSSSSSSAFSPWSS